MQMGVEFEELFFELDSPVHPDLASFRIPKDNPSFKRKIYFLPPKLFQRLSYGDREAQVIGIVNRPGTDLASLPQLNEESFLVILESLEKPGNLGAIIRSADASGCSAVCLANPKTDIFHPNAIRSSMATVFSIPIAVGSTKEISNWLTEREYRILFASPHAKRSLYQTNLTGRVAIVFGSEAEGLSEQWDFAKGTNVSLPMLGFNDSLNVSVTASLFMYERLRQLKGYRPE